LHSFHRELMCCDTVGKWLQDICHRLVTPAIDEILIRRGEKKLCGGV